MGLHLASLLAIAGCLGAGGLLRCRYLPRPGTATVMACVRCGMPAAAIAEPFTCPGCGHDVRETGLAPARGRSPVRPLLAALAYTAVVLVVAMISSAVLVQKVPREQRSFMEASLAGPLSQAYAGVELALSGSEPEGQPSNGTWEVVADLSGRDGRMTSLEARGPYPKWVIITSDGQRLNVGDAAYDRAV